MSSNIEEKYTRLEAEAERQPRISQADAEPAADSAGTEAERPAAAKSSAAPAKPAAPVKKEGRRGKRKADVVRPGPLYQIVDAIITIAGLALVGAIILYVIMIFG